MGKIADFFKMLFSKKPSIDVDVKSDSKSIKRVKKNKTSIDNSHDNSFNNSGTIIDQSSTSIYSENTKDLVVSARWNQLVPHEIKQVRKGIDSFNVLQPVDVAFLPAVLEVNLDNSNNRANAVYFLLRRNSFIKNIHIKSIVVENETGIIVRVRENKDLYGLLDKDRSFLIIHDGLIIGKCIITVEFGFLMEKSSYKQAFTFMAQATHDEFIMPKYQNAELDIDFDQLTF